MSSRGEREREFHNGKYSRVVAKIREFPCSKFCLKLSLLLPATNMWLHAFLTNFNIWWKILFFYQHKELPPKKYEKGAIFGWLIVTLCGKETKSNFNPKGGLLKGTHSYSSCYKVQIILDKKGGSLLLVTQTSRLKTYQLLWFRFPHWKHCLKRIDLGSMYPLVLTAIWIHFFAKAGSKCRFLP